MNTQQLTHLLQAPQAEVIPQLAQVVAALADLEVQGIAREIILQYPTESTASIEAALVADQLDLQKVLLAVIVPSLPFYLYSAENTPSLGG